jgi:hypothetical protein
MNSNAIQISNILPIHPKKLISGFGNILKSSIENQINQIVQETLHIEDIREESFKEVKV